MDPYRSPEALSELHPPAELRIEAEIDLDHAPRVKARRLVIIASPVVAMVVFGVLSGKTLAVYGGLCVIVIAIWSWLRTNRLFRSATLRLVNGKLHLSRQGLATAFSLADLRAVALEEEPDEYFGLEGHGVRRARSYGGTGRCRVLFRAASSSFSLFEYPMSHTEAMECLSSARRFLRTNGWAPPEAASVA